MSANRRALVRKVKKDLTRTLNQLFAGQKPSAAEAQEALTNVLRTYPLPATVGVRLNRVKEGTPPVLELEVFNPAEDSRQKELEAKQKLIEDMHRMTPEQAMRFWRQTGNNFLKNAYLEAMMDPEVAWTEDSRKK